MDSNGDLVTNISSGSGFQRHCILDEFVPPFSSSSVALALFSTFCGAHGSGLAFDSTGNLYVGIGGAVAVYKPPFTSAAAIIIPVNGANPTSLAFDRSGHLYVATDTGSIFEFSPPFSGTSTPVLVLALPGAPVFAGVIAGP
jgi:hypothetical protein